MRTTALVLPALAVALALPHPAAAQDKTATTAAAFLGLGVGARAMAMGESQVAAAEGPSALYWNPSAITDMATSGAEFSYTQYLVGSSFQNAAVVVNAGQIGHFGVSVTALSHGEEEVTTIEAPDGRGERWDAMSMAVGLSYGRALTDRFSVGGTAKFVQERIWNSSDNAVALDLGILYRLPFRNARIGMSMTNFGSDMRLEGRDLEQAIDVDPGNNGNNPYLPGALTTEAWPLPLTYRVGVTMDAYRTADYALAVSADAQAPADNRQSVSLGGEFAFKNLFFLRGGYRQAFTSNTYDQGWTVGAGLRYAFNRRLGLHADYVMQEREPFGNPSTFSVGLTF